MVSRTSRSGLPGEKATARNL